MILQKSPETMTSRERVLKTFRYEKTDRVPIDYSANEGIHQKLMAELGVTSNEALLDALGVDYRGIGASYTGPALFKAPPNRRVDPLEGAIMRKVEHTSGYYWDFCDFPLKDAEDEAFDAFPVPNPDHFDYEEAYLRAKAYGGKYALFAGHPGIPDIINSNGRLMGMEDVLCHLLTDHAPAMRLIRRRAEFQLKMMERLLDKCRGLIDILWLGEDLGTQIGPMISPELYRKTLLPIHRQFSDLASSHGIFCMIHTCGSSSWAYEDFLKIGIHAVDTLQPEAKNMSPEYLSAHFGGRLNFHGCISTAGPLAYGTKEEVRNTCRDTLACMMEKRGYHFAPTHAIQDNSPVENVIAMYQAAHTFGQYR